MPFPSPLAILLCLSVLPAATTTAAPAAPATASESLDDIEARQEWEKTVRILEAGRAQEKQNLLQPACDSALDALMKMELVSARHPSWNRAMMFQEKQKCRAWILELEERLGYSESRLWDRPGGRETLIAAQKKRMADLEQTVADQNRRLDELAAKIPPLQRQLEIAKGIETSGGNAVIRKLQEQVDALTTEKFALSGSVESMKKERDQLRDDLEKLKAEYQQSPRSESRLRSELIAAGLERKRLEEELREVQRRLDTLLPLLNVQQNAPGTPAAGNGRNPDALVGGKGGKDETGTDGAAQLPGLRTANEEYQAKISRLEKELNALRLARPLQVKDFDLIRDNEQLSRRLADLEAENQKLLGEIAALKLKSAPAADAAPAPAAP